MNRERARRFLVGKFSIDPPSFSVILPESKGVTERPWSTAALRWRLGASGGEYHQHEAENRNVKKFIRRGLPILLHSTDAFLLGLFNHERRILRGAGRPDQDDCKSDGGYGTIR